MAGPAPGATPHDRTPTVEALPEVGPAVGRSANATLTGRRPTMKQPLPTHPSLLPSQCRGRASLSLPHARAAPAVHLHA